MAETQSKSGVNTENLDALSVDSTALTDPKADRLGYAPFARHLADSICKMTFSGVFVIAIYGPWNSGKSTLLNFIVHYLNQKPEDEQPLIVPFNPWLFSGSEDITRRFFDQVQSVVSTWKFVPKGLKERVADFAKVFSQIPLPYAQAGNAVATIFDDKQKDASDLKEEVEDTLIKQQPRIVVTIDDIDRLDTEEIKKVFRVIKAFPSFTDVVYLLFCDREIVCKALADTQELSGGNYLDKMVQLSFELPLPDKTLLRRLLFDKLNIVIADTPKHLFEQTYWGNVYFQGIDHFITKSSDIVRLTDTLSVTYPVVKGEVNSVDFIAIESLRVFCPTMYHIIRKNPKAFAGEVDNKDFLAPTVEQLKSLHNSWMVEIQDQDKEPVKRLLLHLFPKLAAVWGNSYSTTQQKTIWRSQLRVCSLEIFPLYFRLVLPEGELPNTEFNALLALNQEPKAFGESLVKLANQKYHNSTNQISTFLERLEDYTEKDIPLNHIPSIVQAFFDVGDQLLRPEDETSGMFDLGNNIRIERLISQLLCRLDEPARFEVLKQAMSNGNALSIIVQEIEILGKQQGKYGAQPSPEAEWLISAQHLKELEALAANRMQVAAQSNTLLQTPDLLHILYFCQKWTSEAEVKQWVRHVISNDAGLVDFLEKFLRKTDSQSETNEVITKYRLDPKWLEPYLEPSSIIERVRSLDEKSGLTEEQTTAIKQFIQEFDIRQQGKDPDDPSAWEVE